MSIIKGKTNVVAGFGGTKRPLGEVFFSQSSLATDNPGALPGWTGEYYENGKTLFPDLYNFVKAHSELQVTKAQYDNAITTYGECPKYVVDENTAQTSLRLPKYANYIKMANSTEGITQKCAGLPNVKSFVNTAAGIYQEFTYVPPYAKPVQNTNSYALMAGSSITRNTSLVYVENDASLDSSIYGASDTVQPAHTTLYPWISAYTSTIPASVADFTSELNKKVSKTGDTMSGPLVIQQQNEIRLGTNDNYYYIKENSHGDLEIYNNNKGLFLQASDPHIPYYFDGTKRYRLLTTADLPQLGATDYVIESYGNPYQDSDWYRKYKSGWIEQGGFDVLSFGKKKVTLQKQFAGIYYCINATTYRRSQEAVETTYFITPGEISTDYIIFFANSTSCNDTFMWRAEGQGA